MKWNKIEYACIHETSPIRHYRKTEWLLVVVSNIKSAHNG